LAKIFQKFPYNWFPMKKMLWFNILKVSKSEYISTISDIIVNVK